MAQVRVWPVKSLGGGTTVSSALADGRGLAGDRAHGLVDLRPGRTGALLTARRSPGLLRWQAGYDEPVADPAAPPLPLVTDAAGTGWRWDHPGLPAALAADLEQPVGLARDPRGLQDLERSVLITTTASATELPRRYGRPLELERWRTNLHLDLPGIAPFAETGWEGRRLEVGDAAGDGVVLRLLHPCGRCAIPTRAPDGSSQDAELLRWLFAGHDGTFGINARVVVPGTMREDAPVRLLDEPRLGSLPRGGRRTHPRAGWAAS